jgi:hypothetical protein
VEIGWAYRTSGSYLLATIDRINAASATPLRAIVAAPCNGCRARRTEFGRNAELLCRAFEGPRRAVAAKLPASSRGPKDAALAMWV